MKRFLSVILLLGAIILSYAQKFNEFTDVNLVLLTDRGTIGRQYFYEFIEEAEMKRGETLEQAVERINRELYASLRKGLNNKSKKYHFGDYPDSKYELKAQFIQCNEDGQRGKFHFTFTNKENGKAATFEKSCRGGTFGTRLHLLNESIEGAGEKAGSYIKSHSKTIDIE